MRQKTGTDLTFIEFTFLARGTFPVILSSMPDSRRTTRVLESPFYFITI